MPLNAMVLSLMIHLAHGHNESQTISATHDATQIDINACSRVFAHVAVDEASSATTNTPTHHTDLGSPQTALQLFCATPFFLGMARHGKPYHSTAGTSGNFSMSRLPAARQSNAAHLSQRMPGCTTSVSQLRAWGADGHSQYLSISTPTKQHEIQILRT